MLLAGCEKNFDPNIYGTLNSSNFPATEKDYESYAMLCYTPFTTTWVYFIGSGYNQHSMYIPEGGAVRLFDATSDIMAPWTTGWGGEWLRFSMADFSNCRYYYRGNSGADHLNHFQKTAEVTRFTEIIGTIENAPDEIFHGDKKRNLIGEARLCRGLMMYYLLHMYGPLPLITDPDDVHDQDKLNDMERPSLDEMCKWITDDFEFAIANMAENVSEQGRYTADYARFCLMKHCLNEGSHMDGYYERGMELYNELNNGKYDLFTSGTNPYADMFKIGNKFNREIIMAVSCSETGNGEGNSGNFWPFMMLAVPTDAAKTDADGNPTPFALQGGGWGQNFNVSPEFYATYEDGDLRKDVILTSYWSTNGYEVNDFGIDANLTFSAYPFRRDKSSPLLLNAHFETSLKEPDHYQQRLFTNHFRWENDFGKISTTKIEGRLMIPRWNLEAMFGYALLGNNIYYDTDGIVRQNGQAMSVMSAYLRKDFRLWKFHLDHQALFQVSSNPDVLPLPMLALNFRYYLQFDVVKKVMQMQIGANGRYTTRWYAPAYNPVAGVFHNQNEEMYGNCPDIDVFVNIQWKRACIFIKLVNVGLGWPNDQADYFSAHHYILPQRTLKVGIFWPFYIQPGKNARVGGGSGSGGGATGGTGGMTSQRQSIN